MNSSLRSLLAAALFAGLSAAPLTPSFAQSGFIAPDNSFSGQIDVSASERGAPLVPGTSAKVTGRNFKPGQQVVLMRGDEVLNPDAPYVADDKGEFSAEIEIPKDAVPGMHPVIAKITNPDFATVYDVKISPDIPLSGEGDFTIESAPAARNVYQVAYSPKSNALFVTSSVGRPPVKQSELVKIDAGSLEAMARITPAEAPAREDGTSGGVFAVYGVSVDDATDTVWVTNTRQNTVAVYAQSDLSLIKQFEPGLVAHARDVVIDTAAGKAYVGATTTPEIVVIDTKTLEIASRIEVQSSKRRTEVSVGSLALSPEAGKLVTVSLSSNEAAIIDTASGEVEKVFALPGANGSIGVAYDAQDDLVFVASQRSDNLIIANASSGEVLHDVMVGAGPLNVAYDKTHGLAFVSNRGSGTITVVDKNGDIVANLDGGPFPNHLIATEDGRIFAVNKAAGEDDPKGDRISRIVLQD